MSAKPNQDNLWVHSLEKKGFDREDALLELFRIQLKKLCGFTYVASTRIQRPTIDRSHFYLVYGTRHVKGLIEFRKVEREAFKVEHAARNSAKINKRDEIIGMNDLFSEDTVYNSNEVNYSIYNEGWKAKEHVINILKIKRYQVYEDILASSLEQFSVTETEIKDILVELKNANVIKFDGMTPRQRKPNTGTIVHLLVS